MGMSVASRLAGCTCFTQQTREPHASPGLSEGERRNPQIANPQPSGWEKLANPDVPMSLKLLRSSELLQFPRRGRQGSAGLDPKARAL